MESSFAVKNVYSIKLSTTSLLKFYLLLTRIKLKKKIILQIIKF